MERLILQDANFFSNSPFRDYKLGDFEKLGGNINLNFKYHTEGVLHIVPKIANLSDEEKEICNRWFFPNKGMILKNIHLLASTLHNDVVAPEVLYFGELERQKYQYWYDKYENGVELSRKIFESVDINIYSNLVTWLARFHSSFEFNDSLIDYYDNRLHLFLLLFNRPDYLNPSFNSRGYSVLIESYRKNLSRIIETDEKVSLIHGDLHGGNILLTSDKVKVLDFEQGVFGGDWFKDIVKLLNVDSLSLPNPEKKYIYRAPISFNSKRMLILKYAQERSSRSWVLPNFLRRYIEDGCLDFIHNRTELTTLDNLFSALVLRSLSSCEDGKSVDTANRDVQFISTLVNKKFSKYLNKY